MITRTEILYAYSRLQEQDDLPENVNEFIRDAALQRLSDDIPELILTAFQNEPVTFLLSNALRHLTQDQQRELCNALQERLPVPASIEDEAERLYPFVTEQEVDYFNVQSMNEMAQAQRSAHITAARQYMDTIDKLRAENAALIEEIQNWKDELKDQAREHRNNR